VEKPFVLLVDDAPEMRVVVTALGKRDGYKVTCRSDVPSAWEYLETNPTDLMLLDVHLPGCDGLALCRRIRAESRWKDLPIALFSHWGRPDDVAEGLKAGVDYLVSKDLVSQPAAWRQRLGEILPPERGRYGRYSLRWKREKDSPQTPLDWVGKLNRALAQPRWQRIGETILPLLLQRALELAFPDGNPPDGLRVDGSSLRWMTVPTSSSRDVALDLVAALTEQIWRLFGAEASQPFWESLASVVPGSPELCSCLSDRPQTSIAFKVDGTT
jgi:CheY-like chemotaxis protein